MFSTLHQQKYTLLANMAPLLQENLCLLRRTMLWEVSYMIILILHIFIDYKFKIEFFYSDIVPEDVFKDKVVRLQDQEYGTIRYNNNKRHFCLVILHVYSTGRKKRLTHVLLPNALKPLKGFGKIKTYSRPLLVHQSLLTF